MNLQTKKLTGDYFQAAVTAVLIGAIFLGLWFGSQIVFNTNTLPLIAVSSGSMNINNGSNDGWMNPFDRTLQKGDVIVIQGVDPKDLNDGYPESDIIVFFNPDNPNELIAHRIVDSTIIDGKLYFSTKGDGNSKLHWPDSPKISERDLWLSSNGSGLSGLVSQDRVLGKVVMRVPWVGNVAIFMHNVLGVDESHVAILIVLLLGGLLFASVFGVPLIRRKLSSVQQKHEVH